MPRIFPAADLTTLCSEILRAAGSSPTEARLVAENLVLANLSGHDLHGVGMLPRYVDAVAEGGLTPGASVEIRLDLGTMLALDGNHGYGQTVGLQAMELGVARAKAHGSCIMTLADAHHLGRIGHFAEIATAEGLISIHFVNVLSRPVVAPWAGATGVSAPIPAASESRWRERTLSSSTSRPAAWPRARCGSPTTRASACRRVSDRRTRPPTDDPGVVVVPQADGLFGAMMTFGEHKGYGIAVACELLGGALTGGGTWRRPADTARTVLNGMLTVLIDPARLAPDGGFDAEARAFVDWLRQSPDGPGSEGVRIAGEPERTARGARARAGIEVDDATWGEIVAAGAKVGVRVD